MNKNFLILQLGILMLSMPALFAKGITIKADMLIWWRCMFGSVFAFALMFILKQAKVTKEQFKWLTITGVIMGFHWWTYFLSIQLSTVAIGLLTIYTYPVMAVFLEPFFFRTKISIKQAIGGFGILLGIFFLVPEFSLNNDITLGITIGLFSSFMFAMRSVLSRKHLNSIPALTTMGYHILYAFLTLTPIILFQLDTLVVPTKEQFGLILILASFFTIGSHGLIVHSFKHYSVSTIGILSGLQVIYGAVLSFLIFTEVPNPNFYIGATIIIGVSVFEMLPMKKKQTTT